MKNLAILFDLDGTLVDSFADIFGVINNVRRSYHLSPRTIEEVRTYVGKGIEHLIHGCFPELPQTRTEEIVQQYKQLYLAQPHHGGRLFPKVEEILQRLKSLGIRLAVATNKSSIVADKTLEYYLPRFRFDLVAGPERVSNKKPHPAHLLEPLRQMGVSPDDAWFVGDDPIDLQCANAARVRFLGATYGIGRLEVDQSKRLDKFSDLPEKLGLGLDS